MHAASLLTCHGPQKRATQVTSSQILQTNCHCPAYPGNPSFFGRKWITRIKRVMTAFV
jgi:hypothetical protein